MKKLLMIFCCMLFAFSMPFLFTGCGENKTMTVFYSEIFEYNQDKTLVTIKAKNNFQNNFSIKAQDFSVKTHTGFRSASHINAGGNIYELSYTLGYGETYIKLLFPFRYSEIADISTIYYLGQEIKILQTTTVNLSL